MKTETGCAVWKVGDVCSDATQLPVGATLWPAGYDEDSWWLVWDGRVLSDSINGFGPYGTKADRVIRSLPEAVDENDPVNHPQHYKYESFEVITVLREAFPDDPLLWQVGKYLLRAKKKGREQQDLEKARFYLNMKIEELSK